MSEFIEDDFQEIKAHWIAVDELSTQEEKLAQELHRITKKRKAAFTIYEKRVSQFCRQYGYNEWNRRKKEVLNARENN